MNKRIVKLSSALFCLFLVSGIFAGFMHLPLASAYTILGNNVASSATGTFDANKIYFFGPFTAASTGYISQINAYIWGVGDIKLAIYTDNAGNPGTLIGTTNTVSSSNSSALNTYEGIYAQVTSGSSYWFAALSSNAPVFGVGGGSTYYYKYQSSTYPTFPTTAITSNTPGTYQWPSIYAVVLSDPFTVSDISATAIKGSAPTFTAQWTTNETLSHYIVQTNRTGSAVNETIEAFTSSWSNYTASWVLDDVGTLEWIIYANTTLGLLLNTGIQRTTILYPDYYYYFAGAYDETTGTYIGECNVTAYFDDGTEPYSFIVNSTGYNYYPETQPLYFDYNIYPYANTTDTTINRQYWLQANENSGNFNIFGNQIGLVHIVFQIRALGGVGLSSFLTVQRLINGTYQTVEQRQVDATGIATMSLQPYTIYRVVALSDDTSTTFGNINTYATPIILTLSALSFPSTVLSQYRYVHIYASRPDPTTIQVSYEDTDNQTLSVYYEIKNSTGHVIYNNTHTNEDSFTDIWSSANASMTYYLEATVSQTRFGTSSFHQILVAGNEQTNPIDLSIFGNFGNIDSTQIIWIIIILVVFLCFSALNNWLGAFCGVSVAAIFVYLGWLHIEVASIVTAFGFVILAAIAAWKRRNP